MQRKQPKGYYSYLLFIALFYFFIFKDCLENILPFTKYGDELSALLAIPIFFVKLVKNHFCVRKNQEGYAGYITIFLLFGFVSSILYHYQDFVSVALPDMFLCMKFWLAVYVGRNLFSNVQMKVFGKRILWHVRFITLLYLVLFVLDQVFVIFPGDIRYGLKSVQLIYGHPTTFVACCLLLIMLLLAVYDYGRDYKYWLIILLFLMCMTLRSKAFGAALAVMVLCYLVLHKKRKLKFRTAILMMLSALAIGWEQIEYYFLSSIQLDSARYQLLVNSIKIAEDHFPWGSGFGTFASYYSAVCYSPIYWMYGLANIYGLSPKTGSFISDSFWPMILGQTGFFGLIAYVLAIIALFQSVQKIYYINRSYYTAALSGIAYLLISSIAESAFVHPLFIPIAIVIGLMLSQRNEVGKEY